MLPFELVASTIMLLWLTPIDSSPGLLLVPGHASTKCYVHSWRRGKAKALRYLHKVELIHIKHAPEAVRSVSLQVTAVPVLCRLSSGFSSCISKQWNKLLTLFK